MLIDQDRIKTILETGHAYYGEVTKRKDARWYPGVTNLIVQQLTPAMRVLDIGCGNGSILLELSADFHSGTGIGIDIDPEHIRMAEEAKLAQGNQNVDFFLLDFPRESAQFQSESFDIVFSLRGPMLDTPECIQAALHLLRRGGLLLCEEIGEQHQHEVVEIFEDRPLSNQPVRKAEQVKAVLERSSVDVRLAADLFTKWIYPDVYAWLQYQCNIWTWRGVALPEPDDPRISLFAERNTNGAGEIETTHHVVWAAGVKL